MGGRADDLELLSELRENWDGIINDVIAGLAADFPVFDGTTFKQDKFAAYLATEDIPWRRLDNGRLDLADDFFREMARAYPKQIGPIREVRVTLAELRLRELEVGSDGRNRCLLSAFRARSSRNQPSNSKFIFGPATWIRSLIAPTPGRALAYVDFSAQEIAIAAALSGDEGLWRDYLADPYIGFGKRAGLLPATATKWSHRTDRDRLKAVVLGVGYGMTEYWARAAPGHPARGGAAAPAGAPPGLRDVLGVVRCLRCQRAAHRAGDELLRLAAGCASWRQPALPAKFPDAGQRRRDATSRLHLRH